jgi:uncharacterized membrane protein YkvI
MKRTGIVLIIIGLILTIITGFGFFTKKEVADIGGVEINAKQKHHVNWSPYVGVGIMVVGGIMLVLGPRDRVRL